MATAHKLARIVDDLLTYRTPYRDRSTEEYEEQARQREIVTGVSIDLLHGCGRFKALGHI
jgi:hypothetical protein